ncbi:MAG: branched-chain amino acid transport system II carrier protein [Desulfovibrio sp.]|jgi:LIVCS family branched-chain amino acid:cation transporter|nr:branched-chain amino acid transport system II carrier protein [Desulfovibrio sp.]
MQNQQRLSLVTLLWIGFAIFSMHFGASCMLWPTTWGRDSGDQFLLAFAGFFFSGLILPWLGYLAVSKGGGPLYVLSSQVGPNFVRFFGHVTIMITGPLFVIPRMSAASWDAVSRVTGLDLNESAFMMSVVFQALYYGIVYWFIYKESQIVDKLSKFLVPALVLIEIAVIGKALIDPIGPTAPPNYSRSPLSYGFVNGYQTMDLTCALMFASIIVFDLKSRLRGQISRTNTYLVIVGAIGFAVMGCIQLGEMYRGHTASQLLPDLNYAKLSATIVLEQYGHVGGIFFNIALAFAAMTTAIGLAAGCGAYAENASNGSLPYKKACIASLILSAFVSVAGLGTIVVWATPMLNLVYPPAIALTLCTAFLAPYISGRRGACYATLLWGAFDALDGYLKLMGREDGLPFIHMVPGQADGLGFVWFMVIGWVLGQLFWKQESVRAGGTSPEAV